MEYVDLGRTGMRVSVAGLGCGGFSRLGLANGASRAHAASLVCRALDAGVNFIDTAASYGTEEVVGEALRWRDRDQFLLSTKAAITRNGERLAAADVVASLHQSLRTLRLEYVDVFHLHGVELRDLAYAREEIVPALQREQSEGRLRALGVTETPPRDAAHEALDAALEEPCFEVMMVAHHMLHQGASRRLLPRALEREVGILGMFAVRQIFSSPQRLQDALGELVASGELPTAVAGPQALDFLVHDTGAQSLVDAAYRFCRHAAGIDVVLFGTGVAKHLDAAIASITAPPLPAEDVAVLARHFGHLRGAGLVAPPRR